MEKASAIILAGGKNSRIARNKAFIELPTGETILQHTIDILQEIFPEIIIVTNQSQDPEFGKDAYYPMDPAESSMFQWWRI